MVMMVVILYVSYTRPDYPEDKIGRTLYITMIAKKFSDKSFRNGWLSLRFCNDYIRTLRTPEMVSFMTQSSFFRVRDMKSDLYSVKGVDMNYWKIHTYAFTEGRQFSEAEFEAGSKVVVIDEKMRGAFFPEGDPLGKEILINGAMFRVVGVVKDVKPTRREAFANCWMPYTWQTEDGDNLFGSFTAILLCLDRDGVQAVRSEVAGMMQRYNTTNGSLETDSHTATLTGPRNRLEFLIGGNAQNVDIPAFYLRWTALLLIVLAIPLFSLSILCFSNLKDRYGEIAVRKAFGANKMDIVREYLIENLQLTLLGGIPGLLLAYVGAHNFKINLFNDNSMPFIYDTNISSYLVMPDWRIVLAILAVCFLISFLSGILPAMRLSKKNIAVVLKGGEA
jgi:putative ABC transport system permease protein